MVRYASGGGGLEGSSVGWEYGCGGGVYGYARAL
jgi:hypothetical protein